MYFVALLASTALAAPVVRSVLGPVADTTFNVTGGTTGPITRDIITIMERNARTVDLTVREDGADTTFDITGGITTPVTSREVEEERNWIGTGPVFYKVKPREAVVARDDGADTTFDVTGGVTTPVTSRELGSETSFDITSSPLPLTDSRRAIPARDGGSSGSDTSFDITGGVTDPITSRDENCTTETTFDITQCVSPPITSRDGKATGLEAEFPSRVREAAPAVTTLTTPPTTFNITKRDNELSARLEIADGLLVEARSPTPTVDERTPEDPHKTGTTSFDITKRIDDLTPRAPEEPQKTGTTSFDITRRTDDLTPRAPEESGTTSFDISKRGSQVSPREPKVTGTTSFDITRRTDEVTPRAPEESGTTSFDISKRAGGLATLEAPVFERAAEVGKGANENAGVAEKRTSFDITPKIIPGTESYDQFESTSPDGNEKRGTDGQENPMGERAVGMTKEKRTSFDVTPKIPITGSSTEFDKSKRGCTGGTSGNACL